MSMFVMIPPHTFHSKKLMARYEQVKAEHPAEISVKFRVYQDTKEELRQVKAALKTAEGVTKRVLEEYAFDLTTRVKELKGFFIAKKVEL